MKDVILPGLVPLAQRRKAFNPRAFDQAYARPANAQFAPIRHLDGSIAVKDGFGYVGGYQVPMPDELWAKAGTIYGENKMQLITQPIWDGSQTFTTASTTTLNFFTGGLNGITGNVPTANILSWPNSFILRAARFIPQLYTSYQTTAAVVTVTNDIGLLIYNGYHTLIINDKTLLRVPLFMMPGGAGIGGAAMTGTGSATYAVATANHGIADPRAIWVLMDPLWLQTQVLFIPTATWNGTQATSGSPKVFLVYDGQQLIPVQ